MTKKSRNHLYIQAAAPYIPNNQSEGSTMVDSLSDLIFLLQLLSLLLEIYEICYSSTLKLKNEKEMSVTIEIFIVVKYQTKVDHRTISPLVVYKKKHRMKLQIKTTNLTNYRKINNQTMPLQKHSNKY